IYVRIPKHQQQFSACHEKLFGSKITKEDIRQYMKNDEALALFLAIGETAKVINSSPVVPQDMSVLNAAPKHEVALNLLYFNGMFKVFDEGFNLYVDTDKNWCDNFKKSLSR
ncbi:MAG: hypothetical protein Q8S75_17895, partial [Nitrospirota bacterium]|nr:hypothetical protein [Nitrospirota bacterium]